jgi:hypothetical protein
MRVLIVEDEPYMAELGPGQDRYAPATTPGPGVSDGAPSASA